MGVPSKGFPPVCAEGESSSALRVGFLVENGENMEAVLRE